jgi:hypothetical protein
MFHRTLLKALLVAIGFVSIMAAQSHAEIRYFSQGGTGFIEVTAGHYDAWKARTLDPALLCLPTGEGDCNCPREGEFGSASSGEQPAQKRLVLLSRRQACRMAATPCNSIVGVWQWPANLPGTAQFNAGGSGVGSSGAAVTWSQSGANVTLQWPAFGTTDRLTLSANGLEMQGTFAMKGGAGGVTGVARRTSPCR